MSSRNNPYRLLVEELSGAHRNVFDIIHDEIATRNKKIFAFALFIPIVSLFILVILMFVTLSSLGVSYSDILSDKVVSLMIAVILLSVTILVVFYNVVTNNQYKHSWRRYLEQDVIQVPPLSNGDKQDDQFFAMIIRSINHLYPHKIHYALRKLNNDLNNTPSDLDYSAYQQLLYPEMSLHYDFDVPVFLKHRILILLVLLQIQIVFVIMVPLLDNAIFGVWVVFTLMMVIYLLGVEWYRRTQVDDPLRVFLIAMGDSPAEKDKIRIQQVIARLQSFGSK